MHAGHAAKMGRSDQSSMSGGLGGQKIRVVSPHVGSRGHREKPTLMYKKGWLAPVWQGNGLKGLGIASEL